MTLNFLIQESGLFKLVEIALIEDKPDFLELMDLYGLDLTNFLNEERFYFLNHYAIVGYFIIIKYIFKITYLKFYKGIQ